MQTNELLIDAFERIKTTVHAVADGMSEDQLTFRPKPEANSIAWLLWHLTRAQDAQLSDLAGHEQAWTQDSWREKFDLPFDASATGYGQTSEDVAQVRSSADLLVAYYDAVHEQTLNFLQSLAEQSFTKIVDTNWDPPVTMAIRLISIIADDLQHCGQAAYVKGLLSSSSAPH